MLNLGICSYSFHRTIRSGLQDIYDFITTCKQLGCTHCEPWNGHMTQFKADDATLSDDERAELAKIREACASATLTMGCLAVDGAHVYEANPDARNVNRQRAYRWIQIAHLLGASQIRIDTGGTADMPDEQFDVIVDGYRDLLQRCGDVGVTLLMENHWGANQIPRNIDKIMTALPDMGLLLDSMNWPTAQQADGWLRCARYAKATHIKTRAFSHDGEELTQNTYAFCNLLKAHGYAGVWSVESTPVEEDEMTAAQRSLLLVRKHAA